MALAPPTNPPTITSPPNGTLVGNPFQVVSGTADPYANGVVLYINGAPTGDADDIDSGGAFSIPMSLVEGTNQLQAAATNRAGEGTLSSAVTVELDSSVPGPPIGVEAEAQADGEIRLTWW